MFEVLILIPFLNFFELFVALFGIETLGTLKGSFETLATLNGSSSQLQYCLACNKM
jgi:hypothetical protein